MYFLGFSKTSNFSFRMLGDLNDFGLGKELVERKAENLEVWKQKEHSIGLIDLLIKVSDLDSALFR